MRTLSAILLAALLLAAPLAAFAQDEDSAAEPAPEPIHPAAVLTAGRSTLAQAGLKPGTLDWLQAPDDRRIDADLAWLEQPGNRLLRIEARMKRYTSSQLPASRAQLLSSPFAFSSSRNAGVPIRIPLAPRFFASIISVRRSPITKLFSRS